MGVKLEAKLEAKLGSKLGAKPGAKLEAKPSVKLKAKPSAIFSSAIPGAKPSANPSAKLGTKLGIVLQMQDCARFCAKVWYEIRNLNTLKSISILGANGLFCCSACTSKTTYTYMPNKHSGDSHCLFERALSGLERLVSNPKAWFEMVSSSS